MLVTIEETNLFEAEVDDSLSDEQIAELFSEGGIKRCTLLDEGEIIVHREGK